LGFIKTDGTSSCEINWGEFEQLLFGPEDPDVTNQALEGFRAFLETLGAIQIAPRLRAKFYLSDVIQKTLVEAWRDLEHIQAADASTRRRWLSRMLENNLREAIGRWREKQGDTHREQSLEAAAAESSSRLKYWVADEDILPEERVVRQDETLRAADALSQLNPRQREALILQKYHGWKLEEIAEHLGCTTGTVAVLHARGLKALRKLLREMKPPPAPAPEKLARLRDYEILEELGRGGMGVVYKARHISLDQVVALKLPRAGSGTSQDILDRFQWEARVLARLQHPNIVQIYDIGTHEGLMLSTGELRPVTYLSLEFVQGGSLAAKLKAEGPQDNRAAAVTVAKLALAVQYAHEQGVVHRNLNPSNVLLTPVGEPKIADFDLAKMMGSPKEDVISTAEGAIVGTPTFMSPEQAAGRVKEIGPATDIYNLGAILYALLTGRPPFRGETFLETLSQLATQSAVPPSTHNSAVDRELDAICLKCLEKEPTNRYGTAAQLADDLDRWLAGQPT
jgi:RNA polymerase sigma-70 factor (subfamily 1)